MANTVANTFDKVGNAIQDIFSGSKDTPPQARISKNNSQSCLEKIGMQMRTEQLIRNEWKKDLQYTKPLVNAEYLIQTEFKVK